MLCQPPTSSCRILQMHLVLLWCVYERLRRTHGQKLCIPKQVGSKINSLSHSFMHNYNQSLKNLINKKPLHNALTLLFSHSPFSERGKAEPSAHEFKSPTAAPRLVHPSNPLPWRIADTKQMCCVLSCHDTELLKETLRTQRFSLNLIFNTTWYLINCRIVCNGNIIIWWQND